MSSDRYIELPVGKPLVLQQHFPVDLVRYHDDKVGSLVAGQIRHLVDKTHIPDGAMQLHLMVRAQYVKIEEAA